MLDTVKILAYPRRRAAHYDKRWPPTCGTSSSLDTDPSVASLYPPFLADLPVTDDSALRTLSTAAHPTHVDSLAASFASTSVSDGVNCYSALYQRPQVRFRARTCSPTPRTPPHGFVLPGASSPSSPRPGPADSQFVEGIPSPIPAPAAAEDPSSPRAERGDSDTAVRQHTRCPGAYISTQAWARPLSLLSLKAYKFRFLRAEEAGRTSPHQGSFCIWAYTLTVECPRRPVVSSSSIHPSRPHPSTAL
ncbi:hypothetical protein K438DRAFT_363718 [Mycena galopus ATCC 62051]|nr:hypothetical protein K438DRAFT_363718 [Mycena galopus ATCC 62051]